MVWPSTLIALSLTSTPDRSTFHRGLGAGQHRTGIFRAQLLQRFATAGGEGFEEGLGVVFDAGLPAANALPMDRARREAVRVF
jgi:hypothetical protein